MTTPERPESCSDQCRHPEVQNLGDQHCIDCGINLINDMGVAGQIGAARVSRRRWNDTTTEVVGMGLRQGLSP